MAEEQTITLKKAPGIEKVEINCQVCHSLAYIPMNSPFLNAQGWDAEVTKMINVMGAPIDQADSQEDQGLFDKKLRRLKRRRLDAASLRRT